MKIIEMQLELNERINRKISEIIPPSDEEILIALVFKDGSKISDIAWSFNEAFPDFIYGQCVRRIEQAIRSVLIWEGRWR